MAANPMTDQMLAQLRNVLAGEPNDGVEQTLVNETIVNVRAGLSNLRQQDIGEVLMHVSPIFVALESRIREVDATVTDRECINIIMNVLAVAGARMHIGARR